MRFANWEDRIVLVRDDGVVDIESASGGRLPAEPASVFARWHEVVAWADGFSGAATSATPPVEELGPPSSRPSQVFAIGLNYAPHAAESGFAIPEYPFVFTKTAASSAPPFGELRIDGDQIDWEVELVAVIGARAERVARDDAWSHIAGVTLGQDYSDRAVQNRLGANSQPTLAKSLPGFGPTGPYLITPDEFDDPNDIPLTCSVNDQVMQDGRTSELIFDVPSLVEYLSGIVPLEPGDLIFTGTPAGVGLGRTPPVYLRDGDVVTTSSPQIGTLRQIVTKK